MTDLSLWASYITPLLAALWLHVRHRRHREAWARACLRRTSEAGLTEPVSLHPVVDPRVCMGSGACTRACPEQTLGIVHGKARIVNPTVCIGHGACAAACPTEAIRLVFGTARRGIDIPYVKPDFETNVPGVYIAGELGGMGLIRKAAEQGRQAIEAIARNRARTGQLDVVIVGAGPAGLSATLAAIEHKLRFVTLDQEHSLGGTVFHYPRNKVVMTQALTLPLIGQVRLKASNKESLLEFWEAVVARCGVPIQFSERVERIVAVDRGYVVRTTRAEHQARCVLLAIGRRGTPRKLGVDGEELPKVVYRLVDPEQYRDRHVLIVGGGDSAVEAAIAVAAEPGARATLSYRGETWSRLKDRNRERLVAAQTAGRLTVLLNSIVQHIGEEDVELRQNEQVIVLKNEAVIVCAGGVLPTPMLREVGIHIETKYGTE